ncbi:hypothetical protein O3P69_011991, partial [Scylla paramamosain]
NSVFCQFTRQKKTDSGLDFPAGDGGALVIVCQGGMPRQRCARKMSFTNEFMIDMALEDTPVSGLSSNIWTLSLELYFDIVSITAAGLCFWQGLQGSVATVDLVSAPPIGLCLWSY